MASKKTAEKPAMTPSGRELVVDSETMPTVVSEKNHEAHTKRQAVRKKVLEALAKVTGCTVEELGQVIH